MSKLNAKLISTITSKETEVRLPDGNSLYLRVRPSGAKSWLFCFRLPGSRTLLQMTLGSLEDVSLKDARNILPSLRKLVSQGIDPRHARAAARTENSQAITMQSLFDAWIKFTKLTAKLTDAWVKRHEDRWRLHLKKPLGNILVRDITRVHLAAALDAMSCKGIKEETRKALTTLNLMLDHALTRHLVEQNHARLLKPKDFSATANRPRDRALPLPELRLLWRALDETQTLMLVTATAIKLLILTGCRRGEIAAMRWKEISSQNGTWLLPATKTKNRQRHVIYLSQLALELIEGLRPLTGQSVFVFDTGQKTGHIHTDSLTTALNRLRKTTLLSEIDPFSIHDIRRSAATAWAEHLKINPHIIERMLNHQPLNKLIATYQHAAYLEEQRRAWLAWGEMVEHQIVHEPGNIIRISSAVNY